MPKVRVEEFNCREDLQRLRSAWTALLARSSSPSLFRSWEWQFSWWMAFGQSRELMLLACFEPTEALIGLLPLYRSSCQIVPGLRLQVLRFLGDGTFDSDNLGCILSPDCPRTALQALWQGLQERHARWDLLELNTLPAEEIELNSIQEILAEYKWPSLRHETPHLAIPLPATWEGYLASLSPSMRTHINRRRRYLEKHYTVDLRYCETPVEISQYLSWFFDMHALHWQARGQAGAFVLPERRAFYQAVASEFLAKGWLRLCFLNLNGTPVAGEFGFCDRGTYSFLQGALDPAYSSRSVAAVLRAYILQDLIEQGVQCYDFLAGDDPYKFRWGGQLRRYFQLHTAVPHSRGAFYLKAVDAMEKTKEWGRRHLPESFFNFLRRAYRGSGHPPTLPSDEVQSE